MEIIDKLKTKAMSQVELRNLQEAGQEAQENGGRANEKERRQGEGERVNMQFKGVVLRRRCAADSKSASLI